ncbi:hypothetical protein NDU88_001039 [Pleurodeles waltl]|uniref:Uncharacterized protein n=1 Tax=Pleurodeles waltl TaxID=8319 RepID=A0AAV7R927_PLEWA|nr:hypothetical protein NDU88_001039 [Pleurodeles waltl]
MSGDEESFHQVSLREAEDDEGRRAAEAHLWPIGPRGRDVERSLPCLLPVSTRVARRRADGREPSRGFTRARVVLQLQKESVRGGEGHRPVPHHGWGDSTWSLTLGPLLLPLTAPTGA